MAFVTENRREEGLLMEITIADNIAPGLAAAVRPGDHPDSSGQDEMNAAAHEVAAALQIKSGAI